MAHSLAPAQVAPAHASVLGWPAREARPPRDAPDVAALAPFRYVLVLRAILINSVALAFAVIAWLQGLVAPIFATDSTYLTHLIVAVFVVGLVTCLRRIVQVSRELNAVKEGRPAPGTRAGQFLTQARGTDSQGRASLAGALRLKLSSRIAGVRQFANNLVLLGLIGTVVGFIMALSGVDPDTVGDAAAIAPMVSNLIEGMGVALYTTLVGSVLNIWLMLNCRLLETASVSLVTQLVELAEGPGRA
ncbi:MAG TPA: MotA/TolQ/ExbB proton channel family protein [Geminicoccaceae bacterium]|nr:MotA/TolQ/ExbB proton channel family protein [Geminicoccaceae bacterium]